MVNRRQFGIWTTAALLVGPGLAQAGGEQAVQAETQAPAPPEPTPLDALTFTADALERAEDTTEASVRVHVHNPGKQGKVVAIDVHGASLVDGETREDVVAWLNDNHPFSRRIMAPTFVDLAPDKALLVGVVKLVLPPEAPTSAAVHLRLQVHDEKGGSRVVDLPPIPLDPKAPKS